MKLGYPWLAVLFLTTIVLPAQSQVRTIVYDGISGIEHCHIFDDTAIIIDVVKHSPAWDAGIKPYDKLISINHQDVTYKGVTLGEVNDLLHDKQGARVHLEILREGVDTVTEYELIRAESNYPRIWFDYEYLVDTAQTLTIYDIISDSSKHSFIHILDAKLTIDSVEEESKAALAGLLPDDTITNLVDVMDNHDYVTLEWDVNNLLSRDTVVEVIRDNQSIKLDLNPLEKDAFDGVVSKFETAFNQSCIWIKFNLSGKISADRDYLIKFFSMADSVYMYEPDSVTGISLKKTGALLPWDQRDFVYKDWQTIRFELHKGEDKIIYLKFMAEEEVYNPWFKIVPLEMVTKYDRLERMVLSFFAGMLFLIIFYYLLLYYTSRKKYYIYYPLFVIGFLLLLLYNWGYESELKYHELIRIIWDQEHLIFALPFTFFLLYGIHYLDLKTNLKFWYRLARWDLWVLLASNLILVLLYVPVLKDVPRIIETFLIVIYALSTVIIPTLILLISTIIRVINRDKPALYFLIAFVVLALLVAYESLRLSEFDDAEVHISNFKIVLENSVVMLGAVIQFLIFSLGLARKMKLDEEEKKIAQARIIEQLKENEKLKDKVNRELEDKVKERTREINDQKEEIETQRDEIEAQRDLVMAQKAELTDSITYARRIQTAVLPHRKYLDRVMPEYFVLFKPRDIVSGDFYWVKEVKNYLIVVAADCTGHGVPGAFMSMLGITLLNELTGKGRFDKAGIILDRLRKKVKETLAQEGDKEEQKDGMDIALVILNKETLELQYSGAYNPLYRVRSKGSHDVQTDSKIPGAENADYSLMEFKGDKQPISIHYEEKEFTTCETRLNKGETIYIFSDGYVDQFGGPNRKKFLSKRFKADLLEIQTKSMKEQHDYLEKTLAEWSKGYEQIDDILVMGIRV